MAFQTAVAFLALALMLLFFGLNLHRRLLRLESAIAEIADFKRKAESVLESVNKSVEIMNGLVEALRDAEGGAFRNDNVHGSL